MGRQAELGDSVLELSANASELVQSYTPTTQQQLASSDADLGSASPALLPGGLVLQGGKDGAFRLLSLAHLNGHDHRLGRLGGELQDVPTPGGGVVLTAPAVWTSAAARSSRWRTTRAQPSTGFATAGSRCSGATAAGARVRSRPAGCCTCTTRGAA